VNTFISGLNLFTVLQLGNTYWSVFGFTVAFMTFFMATWEEFYVEALNLPCFNGANEGIVGVAFLFIVSGIFGSTFWNNTLAGIELKYFIVAGFSVMAGVCIVMNIITVKKKTCEKFMEALGKLNVFIYLVITLFIVCRFSTSDVVSRTARFVIYFVGFSFAKLVGILQASHCAHQDFNQYSKSILLSTTLVNGLILAGDSFGRPVVNEDLLIYVMAGVALFAHIHFLLNVISQFTEVLRIRVFKIGKVTDLKEAMLSEEELTTHKKATGKYNNV